MKNINKEEFFLKFTKEVEQFDWGKNKDVAAFILNNTPKTKEETALCQIYKLWREFIEIENITIFFGMAGIPVIGGLQKLIIDLMKERFFDVLVSVGSQIFHDIHIGLGNSYYLLNISPEEFDPDLTDNITRQIDDAILRKLGLNRYWRFIGDDEKERLSSRWAIEKIKEEAKKRNSRIFGSREICWILGKHLDMIKSPNDSIVRTAFKLNIPVFIPTLHDSWIGCDLSQAYLRREINILWNGLEDVEEIYLIKEKSENTAGIFLGGGVPKNFIQQTAFISRLKGEEKPHIGAIQFIYDPPWLGGLSGCTLSEAQSWGKVEIGSKKGQILGNFFEKFPPVATALLCSKIKRKTKPSFIWDQTKTIKDRNYLKITYKN